MNMHWRSRYQRRHFRLLFAVSAVVLSGLGLSHMQCTFCFDFSPHGRGSDDD